MSTTNEVGQNKHGNIVKPVLIVGLLAAITGFLYWFFLGPFGTVPGGYLLGEESHETMTDWSTANEVPLCQLQTSAFFLPYSINMNCSSIDNELFVGCMGCEEKRWGKALVKHGEARFRIDGIVYPVAARRIMDTAAKDHAWHSSSIKAGRPLDTPRPPDNIWWTFQLSSPQ
jgi:hypothetical protein